MSSGKAMIVYATNSDRIKEVISNKETRFEYKLDFLGVYLHNNGYPEDVCEWLKIFLDFKGSRNRKNDPEYLIHWLINYYITNNYININDLDDFTGIGVTLVPYYSYVTYIIQPISFEDYDFKVSVYNMADGLKEDEWYI